MRGIWTEIHNLFGAGERGACAGWAEAPACNPAGLWMACGQREGLDMMHGRRLSYYPIGRGSMELCADGSVRYTMVNASGTYKRSGKYSFDARGRLEIAFGEDAGVFRCSISGNVMRLWPERAFFRVAEKRLHWPVFIRTDE